jgi:DnaJ-like protein
VTVSVLSPQIYGLGSRDDRPRLNPGADLTAFRLTPVEGFVLSRVDGTLSYEEICLISGIGNEPTLAILRRLRRDRLILGPNDPVPPPAPPPTATPVLGVPISHPPAPGDRRSLLERLDDSTPVTSAELDAAPDLPDELKARIIRLHRRLKKLGPHEMLGLEKDAARAEIKRAYYAASKELHPDRYFGKDLGPFREKLGDIFARLTESFQKLESPKKPDAPKK